MTLDQLYYFRKLAELQHYTKSANELYISQPSLSSSMRNLEKELGASLFQKNGRNVTLTSYGKEFYNCVTAVLKRLDDGIATLKHSIDSTPEKVAIAAPPIYPGNLIAKSIRSFKEVYPKTNIDVFTCIENQKIINGISDGDYDLGICFKADKEEPDLIFVPILRQELVVIAKKGHELSQKEQLLLSDLQGYPLITYRENNPLGTFIRRLFKEQNVNPDIVFAFDEDITISEMVAQDFGVGILNHIPALRNYLAVMPLDLHTDSPILYLAYRKGMNPSKAVRHFIHLLITCSANA